MRLPRKGWRPPTLAPPEQQTQPRSARRAGTSRNSGSDCIRSTPVDKFHTSRNPNGHPELGSAGSSQRARARESAGRQFERKSSRSNWLAQVLFPGAPGRAAVGGAACKIGGGAARTMGGGAARMTGGGATRATGGGAARMTGGGAVRSTGGGATRTTGGVATRATGGGAARMTGGGTGATRATGGGAARTKGRGAGAMRATGLGGPPTRGRVTGVDVGGPPTTGRRRRGNAGNGCPWLPGSGCPRGS